MAVEAVVFDIGNVLIEWQPERHYDAVIGPERRKQMFETVDLHGMNDIIDAGGPFRETIYGFADKYPEWRMEIRMWFDDWLKMASPVIPRSVRLLRALRARGVPVFALSNFGRDSFAYARTHYDFLSEFDRPYISGHMGVIKPDPRIYEMVETDCGIAPDRLLFTDDRADNIAAADARGWQTHLFTSADGWAARLVAEQLLTDKETK